MRLKDWMTPKYMIPLGVAASRATKLISEGMKARQDKIVKSVYQRGTSEHYWWAKGWHKENEEILLRNWSEE